MSSQRNPVIALYGPTAVGKTAIAVELAELLRVRGLDPVAISCDALAVYREIPILTGAPTADERRRLEHRLVGIRSVTEQFSAGEFGLLAQDEIDSATARGRTPIVVGGTGLYMRAALTQLSLRPPVSDEIRTLWQARLRDLGAVRLHALLEKRSPRHAGSISPSDGRRITRALELLDSGIEPALDSEGLWDAPMRLPTVAIGLTRASSEHRHRVEVRAAGMLEAGGQREVQAAELLGPSRTARAALGWDQMKAGDLDALTTKTWQLVRRQRTWMKRSPDVATLDVSDLDAAEAAVAVFELLQRNSPTAFRS